MSAPEPLRWDEFNWDSGHHWDEMIPDEPVIPPNLPTNHNININNNNTTGMESWEITKNRAQLSLPVWVQHTPDLKINKKGPDELEDDIDAFEPLVQQRTLAQDDFDGAFRAVQGSLLVMKILGTKVPAIIEAMLDENAGIVKDVDDLYRNSPRTEGTILKRARDLYPVWVRANTALAAGPDPQAPVTRKIGDVVYTALLLKDLLDGYTNLVKAEKDKQEVLDTKRSNLRELDRNTDQLCKRWYKAAKATADEGSPLAGALEGIPTEGGAATPETIEIATVTQGGEEGLQVLVAYVPGGGDHATTKLIKWQVVGTDAGFAHSAPLDASGNALGPFPQGTEVKIITEVSNSADTRTTAPRTIVLGPPIV